MGGGGMLSEIGIQSILSVVIMDGLTADEIKYLYSVPPYHSDFNNIVAQHFGDVPPDYAYDIVRDVMELEKNFTVLREKRKNGEVQNLKIFMDTKMKIIDDALRDLIIKLEDELITRKEVQKKADERGSGVNAVLPLSSVIGYLYTLKIDIKVMLDYLRNDIGCE